MRPRSGRQARCTARYVSTLDPSVRDPYMQACECLVEMGGRDICECRAKKILNMDAPCTS